MLATVLNVKPSAWAVFPFVGILLVIALFPILETTSHWWERNRNKLVVSLAFGGLTLLYYAIAYTLGKSADVLIHTVTHEFIPFIVLLLSLFVTSGGISLKGDLPTRPATNTAFLAAGALMASIVGTTGASMMLIRPLLQTNSQRQHVRHTVIFFIFLVSNIGGCLLPIGDPPLFLGYLAGVPFLWTLHLWKEWLFLSVVLLIIYFIWDTVMYRHEDLPHRQADESTITPLQLEGKINFVLLLGVVLSVALIKPGKPLPGTSMVAMPFLREGAMLAFTGLSLLVTPKGVRAYNRFNYAPILEVAALFIGIFIAMQPPLAILHAEGANIGKVLSTPARFFWVTGGLSSFLDNAPTYLVFFQVANSMTHEPGSGILQLLDGNFIRGDLLAAISLGAVFMGANTYIGNGPNFMVRSIAEQSGVKMPGFFGYMGYSCLILLPLFVVTTWLFL